MERDRAGRPDGDYAYFKQQMSREVAAACRGALAAGGERILVKDAHDSARNIDPSVLPEEVQINRGWAGDVYSMMSGIQHGDWDAAVWPSIMRPPAATATRFPTPANTSVDYGRSTACVPANFTLNAYMAGYHGVPVCFVSGDAALCDSARRMIPDIATVPVNKGDGNSATSLHPALAVKRIGGNAARPVGERRVPYLHRAHASEV